MLIADILPTELSFSKSKYQIFAFTLSLLEMVSIICFELTDGTCFYTSLSHRSKCAHPLLHTQTGAGIGEFLSAY